MAIKETFNLGVRLTAWEQSKMDRIQGFLRVNQLKVGDSAVARAMVKVASVTEPLIQSLREVMKTRASITVGTSWSLKAEGAGKLEELRSDIETAYPEEFRGLSKNDVVRAIIHLLEPDIPFVGMTRELVAAEKDNRKA